MRTSSKLLATVFLTTPIAAFAAADLTLNPNKAGVQDFHKGLIGVTEGMASNIVDYREQNGDFTSKKELTRVKEIGWDDVNINQGYLNLEGDPESQQNSG